MLLRAVASFVLLLAIPFLHFRAETLSSHMYERVNVAVPRERRHYWLGSFNGSRYLLWLKYRRMGLPRGPFVAVLAYHVGSILAILLLLWLMAGAL